MLCNCYYHTGPDAEAVSVLRCAQCGKQFGRCSECMTKQGKLVNSMHSHWQTAHARFTRDRLSRLGPGKEQGA